MKSYLFSLLLVTVSSCGSASGPQRDEAPAPEFHLSDKAAFTAQIVWNRPPVSQTFDNTAEVYFRDRNGQLVTSSRLTRFHLFMVTMGHPSIRESDMIFEQIDASHWTVRNIYFSMGGSAKSWVIDLDAEVNGQADHIRMSVDHEVE